MNKNAGGPGSGVTGDNTDTIKGMEKSEHISLHTRKKFMEERSSDIESIPLHFIKKVSQEKYVPEKLEKMKKNWSEVKDIPIKVLRVSEHEYHVIDGHHRFLIAKEKGLHNIKCEVFDLEKEEKIAVFDPKLKDGMTGMTQADSLIKATGGNIGDTKSPIQGKQGDDFAEWAKKVEANKKASAIDELTAEAIKEAGVDWSKRYEALLKERGQNEITFTATGDAPKKIKNFLNNLYKADKIGTTFGKGDEGNTEIEWSLGSVKYMAAEGNIEGEYSSNTYFRLLPNDRQASKIFKIFDSITKVNCGTGGSFTIDGKDDYWLDGDGNDHVNNLKSKVEIEKDAAVSEYVKNFEKNILVDFDDVMHNLSEDNFKPDKLDGKPIDGAKEYSKKLIDAGYKILIFSARSSENFEKSKELMEDWLDDNDISYTEVVDKKHPSFVMVDDRVIPFFGCWKSSFEAITTFKPVQKQKGNDKLLMHTQWLQLRMIVDKEAGIDGYIYAHEVSCGGQKVAIMPYKRAGRDAWKILLRNEVTPAWGQKPMLSSITGGIEVGEDKRYAAKRELKEETGYDVDVKDMRYVGKTFGSKMSDSEYHLFVVDVTDKKPGKIEGDGSKLEKKAKNKFWTWDNFESPDPLVYALQARIHKADLETNKEDSDIHKFLNKKSDPYDGIESFIGENHDKIVEALSVNAHRQWSSWAKPMMKQEDLSKKRTERWKKLFVPYEELSEEEKDKDRTEAKLVLKKFLAVARDEDIGESDKVAELNNVDPHDSRYTSFQKTDSVPLNMTRAGIAGALLGGVTGGASAHFLGVDPAEYAAKSALIGAGLNAGTTAISTINSNGTGGRQFVVDKETGDVYEHKLNLNK